jgi:hypothetical protein
MPEHVLAWFAGWVCGGIEADTFGVLLQLNWHAVVSNLPPRRLKAKEVELADVGQTLVCPEAWESQSGQTKVCPTKCTEFLLST